MVVSIWDEELVLYMTRQTWADITNGKPLGDVHVIGPNMLRVERKKEKHGAVSHKKKTS